MYIYIYIYILHSALVEKIRDEDPGITILNDVDRFSAVEGQTYFRNVLGGRHK